MEKVAGSRRDLENERFDWWYYGGSSNFRWWVICILLAACTLEVISVQYIKAGVGLIDYTTEESSLYVPPHINNGVFYLGGLSWSSCQDIKTFKQKDSECKLHFVDTEFKDGDLLVSYAGKPSDASTHVFTLTQSIAEKKYNLFFNAIPKSVFFSGGKAFVKWKYETRLHIVSGVLIVSILLIGLLTSGLNSKLTDVLRQQGYKKVKLR